MYQNLREYGKLWKCAKCKESQSYGKKMLQSMTKPEKVMKKCIKSWESILKVQKVCKQYNKVWSHTTIDWKLLQSVQKFVCVREKLPNIIKFDKVC